MLDNLHGQQSLYVKHASRNPMVIRVKDGGLVDIRTGTEIDGSLSQAQRRLQFEDALGVPQLATLVARDGTVSTLADDEVLQIGLSNEAAIMLETLSRISPRVGELSSQKLVDVLYELCCRCAPSGALPIELGWVDTTLGMVVGTKRQFS